MKKKGIKMSFVDTTSSANIRARRDAIVEEDLMPELSKAITEVAKEHLKVQDQALEVSSKDLSKLFNQEESTKSTPSDIGQFVDMDLNSVEESEEDIDFTLPDFLGEDGQLALEDEAVKPVPVKVQNSDNNRVDSLTEEFVGVEDTSDLAFEDLFEDPDYVRAISNREAPVQANKGKTSQPKSPSIRIQALRQRNPNFSIKVYDTSKKGMPSDLYQEEHRSKPGSKKTSRKQARKPSPEKHVADTKAQVKAGKVFDFATGEWK
jgi:hypothetical protein